MRAAFKEKTTWVVAGTILTTWACNTERASLVPGDVADAGATVPGAPPPYRARPEPPSSVPETTPAPEPGGTHASCVLSADCPAGDYCDLGECIQDCNTKVPCDTGTKCSPRGRCIAETAEDGDPDVSTERLGTLTVTPSTQELSEYDDSLNLELTSTSDLPVRYRVELAAPYLSTQSTRGTFTKKGILKLPVRAEGLTGTESTGEVRLYTTLGDAVVVAPLRSGVSGNYEGAMTYDAASIPLGTVGVSLALHESDGDVQVEMDGERSLLFPEDENGAQGGSGQAFASGRTQFTVTQVVEPSFGGGLNHFRRTVSRQVTFRVEPDSRGDLAGKFEERIDGLMTRTVTLSGNVTLKRRSLPLAATFAERDAEADASPMAGTVPSLGRVFPGWTEANCASIRNFSGDGVVCSPGEDGRIPARCPSLLANAGFLVDVNNYRLDPRTGGVAMTTPGEVAKTCATELSRRPKDFSGETRCAVPARLACALSDIATSQARSPTISRVFSNLYSHLLAPALLVSQNEVVESVKASFIQGTTTEVDGLERAAAVLDSPVAWVLSPPILEYLANVPAAGAPEREEDGTLAHVEALRKLSRTFFMLSTIDGELSRAGTANPTGRTEQLDRARVRGVLTLLEAASVVGVLDRWGQSAPEDVGVEFTDVLSPMDLGFRTLLEGAVVFGIPEGFIPFVRRAGDSANNFRQVLASIEPKLKAFTSDQTLFVESNRQYEANDDAIERQILDIQIGLEGQIRDICGPDYDVEKVSGDDSWASCGQGQEGEVAALSLNIEQAKAQMESSQERIRSLHRKIQIELNRVRDVKEIRDGTVRFISSNGAQLNALTMTEGAINAAQKAAELASQSAVTNFGAPAAGAAVVAVLELQRTLIQAERERLQTAKEMKLQADSANVELINGMAGVQTMTVDVAQLSVEMNQNVIGIVQAELNKINAVNRAKRYFVDRAKSLAQVRRSPAQDPSFRILQDGAALRALRSRSNAQTGLYLAARALEYELNQPFGDLAARAVFNVHGADGAGELANCLADIASDADIAKGQPQAYTTELSVRKLLGIEAEREDEVTGARLTTGDQFRRALLQNANLDGHGGAGISFASSLRTGNGVWPSNVCDDKIVGIEVQLVGDFSGDNDAQVEVSLEDGGVLRRCDRDEPVNWSTAGRAVVQAGVNSYGNTAPNLSLAGLSVASSRFRLVIPGAEVAPANADLDLRKLDDVLLRIRHEGRPLQPNGSPVKLSCLTAVGVRG